MAYKNLNKAVPRIEGADKVSGNTRYAADIPFPAALSAKILRTSLPHARILDIDTSKALKLPGVRAIITGADVAGVMVGPANERHASFGDGPCALCRRTGGGSGRR